MRHDPSRDPTDDDRYVGQARVPLPVTAIPYTAVPYTDPYVYPQPPPPRRRRSPLFAATIAVALVLVCSLGLLFGLALGSGRSLTSPFSAPEKPSPTPSPSPSPAPPPPKKVAETFLAATISGDKATAEANTCKLLRGKLSSSGLSDFVGYEVGEEKVNALGASVRTKLKVPILGSLDFDLYLIQEDKSWKVCGLGPS